MFNIEDYPDIIFHLKSISNICSKENSGWYSIFCPYCDDATRKFNPRHGHFHISSSYTFCHCFRCGKRVSLYNLLVDTKFKNEEILSKIKAIGNFTYNHQKTILYEKQTEINKLYSNLLKSYIWMQCNKPNELHIIKKYLEKRFLEINPIPFLIHPTLYNNKEPAIQFFNFSGYSVVTRLINNPSMRYINKNKNQLYYFQDILSIDEKQNIIITEGPIDLINAYNYCNIFNRDNSFYIAINGIHYKKSIIDIINNFLLIGKYNISIIFDQNVKNLNSIILTTKNACNELNPEIHLQCFKPIVSKDISECMNIEQIWG